MTPPKPPASRRQANADQEQGRNRLNTILALVGYLLHHPMVPVTTVTQALDIPGDEVRSLVRIIATSGIPGDSTAYLPNDLFDIDWDTFDTKDVIDLTHTVEIEDTPALSWREAAALLVGLRALSGIPEIAEGPMLADLTAKLARGTGAEAAPPLTTPTPPPDTALGALRSALTHGHRITFRYLNGLGEVSARLVDPLQLTLLDTAWYLRGYCHTRQDPRTFRLDRMSEVTETDVPAEPHCDVHLPEALYNPSAGDVAVQLRVDDRAISLLGDYLAHAEVMPGEARLRVAHIHGLKRLVTQLGGLTEVRGPAEARRAVADWARRGLAQYSE